MPDLLIRDISNELQERIERQARDADISVSDAAKTLIQRGLSAGDNRRRLGTELFELIAPEDRVDLDCEIPGTGRAPPDFS